jgi:hypothetical protein
MAAASCTRAFVSAAITFGTSHLGRFYMFSAGKSIVSNGSPRMLECLFMPQLEGGVERLNLDKLF